MVNLITLLLLPLLIAALVTYFATPIIIRFADRLKIVDDPKKHLHPKVIHTYPTPRGGGVPLFLGILITSILFLPIDKHLLGILIGALILTALGLLDDRYDLSPYKRLVIQFTVAAIPIAAGIGISFIKSPFNGIIDLSFPRLTFQLLGEEKSIWILSDLFAIFWMVTLMNFINMGASGLDGNL